MSSSVAFLLLPVSRKIQSDKLARVSNVGGSGPMGFHPATFWHKKDRLESTLEELISRLCAVGNPEAALTSSNFHLFKPPGKNKHISSSARFLLKTTGKNKFKYIYIYY